MPRHRGASRHPVLFKPAPACATGADTRAKRVHARDHDLVLGCLARPPKSPHLPVNSESLRRGRITPLRRRLPRKASACARSRSRFGLSRETTQKSSRPPRRGEAVGRGPRSRFRWSLELPKNSQARPGRTPSGVCGGPNYTPARRGPRVLGCLARPPKSPHPPVKTAQKQPLPCRPGRTPSGVCGGPNYIGASSNTKV